MPEPLPPPGVPVTRHRHRVPFYETDAMGLVHHANCVRFLELARIRWMDEHHRPYREYVAEGLHFATTRVELDYLRGLRFDDEVEIAVWLAWARGASLRMEYALSLVDEASRQAKRAATRSGAELIAIARGATEHAMVDTTGRVRRIPEAQRRAMASIAAERAAGSP
ncbi:MAG: acyl-CoA thioesterase [Deltaproteobacteria bacterium]|nr:acyl-CoA thioesterase [Deltaproteobacteria bacterium]